MGLVGWIAAVLIGLVLLLFAVVGVLELLDPAGEDDDDWYRSSR